MYTHIAYIGLGSNIEEPVNQIKKAFAELGHLPYTHLLQYSSLYQTKPVGYADQPDFINAVAKIKTELTPDVLLEALMKIESSHHRVRGAERDGPRHLDLDILLYDDLIIEVDHLIIPHPRLTERLFVLLPLNEISPHLVFPNKMTLEQAIMNCRDDISRPCMLTERE